jgi:hypothetical protein
VTTKARRGADPGTWTVPKPDPDKKPSSVWTPKVKKTRGKADPAPHVVQIDRRGTADLNKAVAASFGRTAKKLRARAKADKPTVSFHDLVADIEAEQAGDAPTEDTAYEDFAARFQKAAEARAARLREGDE